MRKFLVILLILSVIVSSSCASSAGRTNNGGIQNSSMNTSDRKEDSINSIESGTETKPVNYKPRKMLDYYYDEKLPWDKSIEFTVSEFPDITFRWTSSEVKAIDDQGETILYTGMPVWSIYLCDITGDGLPEICSAVSFGSGIVDDHIIAYDYAERISYTLWDRGNYDYYLEMDDDMLTVVKKLYNSSSYYLAGSRVAQRDIAFYEADKENKCLRESESIKLTIDKVKELAKKGSALTWDDFYIFDYLDVGSGWWVIYFPIDEEYCLKIAQPPDIELDPDEVILSRRKYNGEEHERLGALYLYCDRNSSDEIFITKDDIDAFMNK